MISVEVERKRHVVEWVGEAESRLEAVTEKVKKREFKGVFPVKSGVWLCGIFWQMQQYVERKDPDQRGSEGWSWNDDMTSLGVAVAVNGCRVYVRVVIKPLDGSR